MEYIIRPATRKDAESIGRLAGEFADYLRSIGDAAKQKFDAEVYLRDGFGFRSAFEGIVAEQNDEIIGCLLYHFGYDVDYATRILHVIDLYVGENRRGSGIGRALMRQACDIGRVHGATQLFWAVYEPNKAAIRFYERLGARFTQNMLFMRLDV
jgi:ribosomal protein S18 acetylase RimI-like enzyme